MYFYCLYVAARNAIDKSDFLTPGRGVKKSLFVGIPAGLTAGGAERVFGSISLYGVPKAP